MKRTPTLRLYMDDPGLVSLERPSLLKLSTAASTAVNAFRHVGWYGRDLTHGAQRHNDFVQFLREKYDTIVTEDWSGPRDERRRWTATYPTSLTSITSTSNGTKSYTHTQGWMASLKFYITAWNRIKKEWLHMSVRCSEASPTNRICGSYCFF